MFFLEVRWASCSIRTKMGAERRQDGHQRGDPSHPSMELRNDFSSSWALGLLPRVVDGSWSPDSTDEKSRTCGGVRGRIVLCRKGSRAAVQRKRAALCLRISKEDGNRFTASGEKTPIAQQHRSNNDVRRSFYSLCLPIESPRPSRGDTLNSSATTGFFDCSGGLSVRVCAFDRRPRFICPDTGRGDLHLSAVRALFI